MGAGSLSYPALFTTVPATAFPAQVLRCYDSNTCIAETGQGTLRIPLTEIYQPYGAAAHDLLCAMVCGTDIDIESRGTKYERTTGLIRVGDIDTSEVMIWVGRLGTMPGMIVIRY